MAEANPRRPVLADHPVVVAAVAVLRDAGVPLGSGAIYERAVERGLLASGMEGTLRARLSAHTHTASPAVVVLPGRKGYQLADAPAEQPEGTLRAVVLTPGLLRTARAHAGRVPPKLARYVAVAGEVPLKAAVLRATGATLEWLLRAFPFAPPLAESLRNAEGGERGRACVLAVAERKRDSARRVVRVRVARRAGRATG